MVELGVMMNSAMAGSPTDQIPPSVILVQILALSLDRCSTMLIKGSDPFKQAFRYLRTGKGAAPVELGYFYHALLMALLSMHQGVLIPALKQIDWDSDTLTVTIIWNGGIRDSFTLGEHDESAERFAKTVTNKVFGYGKIPKGISIVFLGGCKEMLSLYEKNLRVTDHQIKGILRKQAQLHQSLKDDVSADLMFLIVACLPAEQLSQLFTHIHEFFPEDLKIKTQDGNQVSVVSLFQSPSSDIQYLIKKVMVYNDLYFGNDLPIIREITHIKTKDFLLKLLENKQVERYMINQLTAIQNQQVDPRTTLYTILIERLTWLLQGYES